MNRTARDLLKAGCLALALAAAPAASESRAQGASGSDPAAQIGAERFAAFMESAAAPCAVAPAEVCIDRAWLFADRDRDGGLAAGELQAVKNELTAWAALNKPTMTSRERASLAVAEMLVRALRPPMLIQGFDSDGDATLSQPELTQDLALDGETPLGEILQDKAAVNWQAMQQRLGPLAPLIGMIAQAQGVQ